MRLNRLYIRDVKRIRLVDITFKGNTVVIGGKNGEGKTTFLDSIAYLFAGKKGMPAVPIRRGARNGEIVGEIGDLVVTRTISKRSTELEVTVKKGVPEKSPQKILDELFGTHAGFDPLAFIRRPAKDQLNILRDLAGLDFGDLDERREAAYAERKLANREVKRSQAALDAMRVPEKPDVDGPVTVVGLTKELRRRQDQNQENREARNSLTAIRTDIQRVGKRIKEIELELAAKKKESALLLGLHRDKEREVAGLVDEDYKEITDQIEMAEQINEAFRVIETAKAAERLVEDAQAEADKKTSTIEAIDQERADLVAAAKMPIEGLGFGDDCITLDGLPFDQASGAEQFLSAVRIALAMSGELKVVLIRDGSGLDENSLARLFETVVAADAQVFVEQVDPDHPSSIILVDGRVKENGE